MKEKRAPNPEPEYLPESLFDFSNGEPKTPTQPVLDPKEMEPWPTLKKEEKKEYPLQDLQRIQRWLNSTLEVLKERQQKNYSMRIAYDVLVPLKKQLWLWGKLQFLFSGSYRTRIKREVTKSFMQLLIRTAEAFKELAKSEGAIESPVSLAQLLYMFDSGFSLTMDLYFEFREWDTPEYNKLRKVYAPIYANLFIKRSAIVDYCYDMDFLKQYYPGPRSSSSPSTDQKGF